MIAKKAKMVYGIEIIKPATENANKLADTVICLPLHAELTEADMERILNLIIKK